MLRKLSVQVQVCFDRALDAKRKADTTANPARKAEFRQFEKSWLVLAESYELTERLTDFTAENAGWRRRFNERRRVGARQDDEVCACKRSYRRATSTPSLSACGFLPSSSSVMTR
jgi:hypothetical protein